MSLTSLSIKEIFENISNSFVSVLSDMYNNPDDPDTEVISPEIKLLKENRYMYLALLSIILLVVGNVIFTTE